MEEKNIELSILIPVYNSEKFVDNTVQQTILELDKLHVIYEIILVNDGSKDNSWNVIHEISKKHPQVVAIDLLRNYGQHSAVLCAMQHASGKYLVTIDDDLQNPPSEIVKLYNKIKEGYDLVFAKFDKKKHASYRKMGTHIIRILNEKVFNKPKNITLTNFRIFTQDVSQRAVNHCTFHPYIPGLLLMYSGNIANTTTQHSKREEGKSNYTLFKILKLVSRILFNYSTYPLNLVVGLGIIVSFFSFSLGLIYVLKAFLLGSSVPGWTTVVVLLSFFNGVLMLILGVLGQYIVRLMKQTSHKTSYVVRSISQLKN